MAEEEGQCISAMGMTGTWKAGGQAQAEEEKC